MIVVGCGVEASRNAIRLASEYPDRLFATVGVHPHDAGSMTDEDFEAIARMAERPEVVAVGETGLDYHYDRSPRDVQRRAFSRFLELSRRVRKPVVIHTREAEQDTIAILREHAPLAASGQLHCFTGTMELAEAALELGMFVSFSGAVTFANAGSLRDCARALPMERLLVETDCPYLTPAPFRGRENEPMMIPVVAATLAEQKGLSVEDVGRRTTRNARALFELPAVASTTALAFAGKKEIYVALGGDGVVPERLIEAASRYPAKKIARLVGFLPPGARPSPAALDAVRRLADDWKKPFLEQRSAGGARNDGE